MPFSLIPFLLLVIPIVEIVVFIVVGGQIGIFATLALIFLTAVIGTFLLRQQGFAVLTRIRSETEQGRIPGRDLGDGAMILVAGVLLLTPGFVTDAIGFALFVPQLRDLIWNFLRSRITVVQAGPRGNMRQNAGPGTRRDAPIVDLDADEYAHSPKPESPWRDKPDP